MLVAVLHVKKFGTNPNGKLACGWGRFESSKNIWDHVANMYVPDGKWDMPQLGWAFQQTNHGTNDGVSAWYDNPGVACFDEHARSTSMYDLMITDQGEIWQVDGVGYKLIEGWNKSLMDSMLKALFERRNEKLRIEISGLGARTISAHCYSDADFAERIEAWTNWNQWVDALDPAVGPSSDKTPLLFEVGKRLAEEGHEIMLLSYLGKRGEDAHEAFVFPATEYGIANSWAENF